MRLRRRDAARNMIALGTAVLLASIAGRPISARATTAAPFDFTGHWTGIAQETGKPDTMLTADLMTGDHPRLFVGGLIAEQSPNPPVTCTVKGKLAGLTKVKIRLSCTGGTIKLRGLLDQTARSVTGMFTRPGRHRVHRGTFMLTEQTP